MDVYLVERMGCVCGQYADTDAHLHLRTYRKHLRGPEASRKRISGLRGYATTTANGGRHQSIGG